MKLWWCHWILPVWHQLEWCAHVIQMDLLILPSSVSYIHTLYCCLSCSHVAGNHLTYIVCMCSEYSLIALLAYWVKNFCTIHGKILAGEKLANLANIELFTIANRYRYTENVFGVSTDCSLFAKVSSPIAFTCMVRQNFPSPNISCARWFTLVL